MSYPQSSTGSFSTSRTAAVYNRQSPPPPSVPFAVGAEVSALIHPGQKSTWITLKDGKAKYHLYLSNRSRAAIKGFSLTQIWVPSYLLSESEVSVQSKRKWETRRAAPKNYLIFIFQWFKECLSREKSVRG